MSLATAILIRYARGWEEEDDAALIAATRRAEAALSVGAIDALEDATLVAQRIITDSGSQRVASVAEIEPTATAQTPYLGFEPFDSVRLTQPSGSLGTVKVKAVTGAADVAGEEPAWVIEASNLAEVEAQETETLLRRIASGFLGGTTETANPAVPVAPFTAEQVNAKRWTASKAGALATGDLDSQKEKFGTTAHVCMFFVTITTAASSGTTTVVLRRSGTIIATVNIAAGTNEGWVGLAASSGLVQSTDTLQVSLTAVGTGAEGLAATARYI